MVVQERIVESESRPAQIAPARESEGCGIVELAGVLCMNVLGDPLPPCFDGPQVQKRLLAQIRQEHTNHQELVHELGAHCRRFTTAHGLAYCRSMGYERGFCPLAYQARDLLKGYANLTAAELLVDLERNDRAGIASP